MCRNHFENRSISEKVRTREIFSRRPNLGYDLIVRENLKSGLDSGTKNQKIKITFLRWNCEEIAF